MYRSKAGWDEDKMKKRVWREGESVILVGMPGAGKSTVGRLLAERMGYGFVDTDRLIETVANCSLQDIVDREGYEALRRMEEKILLEFDPRRVIVATGGSAVYSEKAMKHVRTKGVIVFLDVNLATLEQRIRDFATRGISMRPRQRFEDLFCERYPLYEKYADLKIENSQKTPSEAVQEILDSLDYF